MWRTEHGHLRTQIRKDNQPVKSPVTKQRFITVTTESRNHLIPVTFGFVSQGCVQSTKERLKCLTSQCAGCSAVCVLWGCIAWTHCATSVNSGWVCQYAHKKCFDLSKKRANTKKSAVEGEGAEVLEPTTIHAFLYWIVIFLLESPVDVLSFYFFAVFQFGKRLTENSGTWFTYLCFLPLYTWKRKNTGLNLCLIHTVSCPNSTKSALSQCFSACVPRRLHTRQSVVTARQPYSALTYHNIDHWWYQLVKLSLLYFELRFFLDMRREDKIYVKGS